MRRNPHADQRDDALPVTLLMVAFVVAAAATLGVALLVVGL